MNTNTLYAISTSGLLLLLSSGHAAWRASASTRIPILTHREQPLAQNHVDGIDYILRAELVPDAIIKTGGKEALEYHAEFTAQRGGRVGVGWEIDVISDRGRVVAQPITGQALVKQGQTVSTESTVVSLADGYYAIRVHAAVSAKDEPDDLVRAHQYIVVKNGVMRELTDEKWIAESAATMASNVKPNW